jgi:hypothetical protein
MDSAVSHASSHPLVGMITAAVGVGAYASATLVRWFLDAAHFAQAATPSGSWTWDNVIQAVAGATAVVGGLFAFVSARIQKAHADKIERMKAEADAQREIWQKDEMARINIAIARQHAHVCERLDRQDAALGIADTPAGRQDSRQEN